MYGSRRALAGDVCGPRRRLGSEVRPRTDELPSGPSGDPCRMAATTTAKSSIAAQWRAARRLYPIYAALAKQFALGSPPFESLSTLGDSESEVLHRVETWLAEMDERIQAHQFRQILQSSFLATS